MGGPISDRRDGFYKGVRASITWLHAEAAKMNDPHAKSVLNNAAFHLGTDKPDPNRPDPSGVVEALKWYAEQVEGCRKLGSIGEPFRNALDADGGKRALAALRSSATVQKS